MARYKAPATTIPTSQLRSAPPSITGAGNDRTFVVLETNHTSVGSIVWLFRLQVSASGRSIQVTRLPVHVPSIMAIDDIALSPDGSRLAMTAQWNCGQDRCHALGRYLQAIGLANRCHVPAERQ